MAAEDYVVADRPEWQGTNNVTASDRISETEFDNPDTESAAAAESAGVSHPAYIGYAAALNTHQARPDIETLADRRTREYGTTFGAADFMRKDPYNADGSAKAPPRPGTVHGDAPKSS